MEKIEKAVIRFFIIYITFITKKGIFKNDLLLGSGSDSLSSEEESEQKWQK